MAPLAGTLSVSGAIFLIPELGETCDGLLQMSGASLRHALAQTTDRTKATVVSFYAAPENMLGLFSAPYGRLGSTCVTSGSFQRVR